MAIEKPQKGTWDFLALSKKKKKFFAKKNKKGKTKRDKVFRPVACQRWRLHASQGHHDEEEEEEEEEGEEGEGARCFQCKSKLCWCCMKKNMNKKWTRKENKTLVSSPNTSTLKKSRDHLTEEEEEEEEAAAAAEEEEKKERSREEF